MSIKFDESLPLTLSQCPAGDDPERHHEHEQHCAGANCHQRFQYESGKDNLLVTGKMETGFSMDSGFPFF